MAGFFSRLLSVGSDKELKAIKKEVARINDLGPRFEALSDAELSHMTVEFKERLANGETLDALLPEAFATVREASWRTLGMRHFDVQLIGGTALHRGLIAEMKTGEGKTLVSTLAGYLNALDGKGVHIVTVNDYLAKRDSEWMGQIYRFMGMEVGLIQNGMKPGLKKPSYQADVTYGTNAEFGFDYLRDNMVTRPDMRVQRGHHYAIVDEVDSILIDEARTPLIISGAGTRSADTYKDFARAVRGLVPDVDFEMDEAKHTIAATEEGLEKVEERLGIENIYSDMSGELVNHLQQALKAEYMFHRDQQYAVIDGEVKIVDEFTGRIMEGRRYSEGLHQAIEAKEGVLVREENQTLATITLQNYFRLYDKLSGMTGTALTEDAEFREIYDLGVQAIPPNKPVIRKDHDDVIYRTTDDKFNAVVRDVKMRHDAGQPVLIGTVSVENSERLSRMFRKLGIQHQLLNAKFHEREANIVAQAGREGVVTIATNMAGRGTDILLGGNPDSLANDYLREAGIEPEEATSEQRAEAKLRAKETCATEREHVLAAGGLCVIGTERHESRRIDNQLRGRAGRQGDPGESQFYLSLDDDLMRLFGGDRMDRIKAMMERYNLPSDEPIQAKMVSKAVEGAQRKVEEINFAMRKNVLDYDDVMNKQRQVIYEERNKVLDGKDLTGHIDEVMHSTVERAVNTYCSTEISTSDWDFVGLNAWIRDLTGSDELPEYPEKAKHDQIVEIVYDHLHKAYEAKAEVMGAEILSEIANQVMLRVIDTRWMAYLQEMDYLKTGIGLRGFGQRDPLVEYKTEAYAAFGELVGTMYEDFLRTILRIQLAVRQPEAPTPAPAAGPGDASSDDEPAALQGAHYSGPADVDGDQGERSALRAAARMYGPAGKDAEVPPVPDIPPVGPDGRKPTAAQIAQWREARERYERDKGQQSPGAPAEKPRTYRKDEDPNPYVGIGRNEPCPCGSGKKFKNCHGRNPLR